MKLKSLIFFVFYFVLSLSVCQAQFETIMFSPTPESGGLFGKSVAIEGDFMFVGETGAYNELTGDNYAGVVEIFKRESSGWKFHQKIAEPEIRLYSDFGYSIDINQNYAIIGAPGHASSGAAFIYKRIGDEWVRQLKLPEKYRSRFGHSVAIDENYAIVGAIHSKGNGLSWSDRGSAWVYKKIVADNVETWIEIAHLTASDEFDRAHFGYKVQINDGVAVVSAYTDAADENYQRSSVYVFEQTSDNWEEVAKLIPEDAEVERRELFGWDIKLFRDKIIVGTPHDMIGEGNYGSAYIFEKEGNLWIEKAKLHTSGQGVTNFGSAVAMNDELVVVGAITNYQGSAYVFRKDGSGWVQIKRLFNQDTHNKGSVSTGYGGSIDVSIKNIAIGHIDHYEKGSMAGSAFIYDNSYLLLTKPIELTASMDVDGIELKWKDISDTETGFIIEKSLDSGFSSKQVFTSNANTTSYTDQDIQKDVTYFYRVKADNGVVHSDFSNVVEVSTVITGIYELASSKFQVFPNPVIDYAFFQFSESSKMGSRTYLRINSIDGKLVYEHKHLISELEKGVKFPPFRSGIYIVSLRFEDKILTRKIIVNQ